MECTNLFSSLQHTTMFELKITSEHHFECQVTSGVILTLDRKRPISGQEVDGRTPAHLAKWQYGSLASTRLFHSKYSIQKVLFQRVLFRSRWWCGGGSKIIRRSIKILRGRGESESRTAASRTWLMKWREVKWYYKRANYRKGEKKPKSCVM